MRFLDLFAGIGGFRLGMERAGHKCIGFCEIDKYARASYQAIHDTEGEIDFKDITEVTNEEFRKLRGKVDIICGGFPCQAFSIAGKQLGFEDTRGTLKISEFPKTENECSLSDILEENVAQEYFLSETTQNRLMSYQEKELLPIHLQQDIQQLETDRMLLKINRRK